MIALIFVLIAAMGLGMAVFCYWLWTVTNVVNGHHTDILTIKAQMNVVESCLRTAGK